MTTKRKKQNKNILNYELLQGLIRNSKKSFTCIELECGISRDALYTKVNGERDFRLPEYINLCNSLGIRFDLLIQTMEM